LRGKQRGRKRGVFAAGLKIIQQNWAQNLVQGWFENKEKELMC
jgi:hypothetical protein